MHNLKCLIRNRLQDSTLLELSLWVLPCFIGTGYSDKVQ